MVSRELHLWVFVSAAATAVFGQIVSQRLVYCGTKIGPNDI